MGLFDAFKKKKVVAKELETPPAPEQNPPFNMGQAPASSGDTQSGDFSMQQMPAQNPILDFPLPRQNASFPSSNPAFGMVPEQEMSLNPQMTQQMQISPDMQMPQQVQHPSFSMSQYEDIPMPEPDEMAPQQIPPQPKMGSPIPSFRFYKEAAPEDYPQSHEEMHQDQGEIPFDISQELMSMPEMMKQHDEHEEQKIPSFSSIEKAKKKATPVENHLHFGKKFITVTILYDVGEQLVNMAEDLGLAKDTAFRLTDLNEQEIEMMAKWQTLQQNMELRLAEMDKIMFKA